MIVLITSGLKIHKDNVNNNLDRYGNLVTPRCKAGITRNKGVIGVDNDRFNKFYSNESFLKLLIYLSTFKEKERIKFIAAPDVPFNSQETLKDYFNWYPLIKNILNLPVALVTQDGMTFDNLEWDKIDAIFVGGSTEWKLGIESQKIIKKAQELKKWVHVGRVNTPDRFNLCRFLQVNSIDGTSFSMFYKKQVDLYEKNNKQILFDFKI